MSAHQKGAMVTDRGGMNTGDGRPRRRQDAVLTSRIADRRSPVLWQHRRRAGTHGVRRVRADVLLPDLHPPPPSTLTGGPVTPLVHVHAALFSAWVLLFIAQTTLVAQRKLAVHRRLGIAGGVLAALMVVFGTLTALKKAARGEAPAGVDPHAVLDDPPERYGVLRRLRRSGAAPAREPGGTQAADAACLRLHRRGGRRTPSGRANPRTSGLLRPLVSVHLGGHHLRPRRRVVASTQCTVWGGGVLVISVPLRLVISRTEAWTLVAQWLVCVMRSEPSSDFVRSKSLGKFARRLPINAQ